MDTLTLVPVSAAPAEFLVVEVIIITTSTLVCPVLEGDVGALHRSDMRLVNLTLTLRVNGQDEKKNTIGIASRRRRLLVVLSPAAVAAAVLCLERSKVGQCVLLTLESFNWFFFLCVCACVLSFYLVLFSLFFLQELIHHPSLIQ